MKNMISALLALASCFAVASTALSRDVSDEAKFFSPEVVRKANTEIAQFKDKYHKDIVVETYSGIPDNKKAEYQPDKKNEFYNAWMRERAQTLKVDGIYMLITREPAHLQVGVGAQTAKLGFTHDDRDKIRNILVEQFKNKAYDDGLLNAIAAISNRFAELNRDHPVATPSRGTGGGAVGGGPQSPGGLSWMAWLIIGIVGLLIVRFIARAFQRMAYSGPQGPSYGPRGYGPAGYGPAGYGAPPASGGGFFSSMLGGLFGGAAGNWLASRWMGTPQDSNPMAPPHGYQGDESTGFEGSSGGDFGPSTNAPADSGGGGDFGNAEPGGGGDFGGGGGGGSDGGGAGGDF